MPAINKECNESMTAVYIKIVMKARQLKIKYNKDMPAIKIKMQ